MSGPSVGRLLRQSGSVHVSPRDLLGNPRFRRALLAQYTSQTFDAACTLLLAKVFLFGTPDGPAAGQVISAALTAAVPLLVGGPIAAIVVDRFPRRRILLAGQAIRGAVAFTYLVLEMTGSTHFVYPLAAFALCVGRVLYTARVASVRHLVRQHELVGADSMMLTVSSVAGVSGATVGAAMFVMTGPGGFVGAGLGHLLAAVLYGFVTTDLGGGTDRLASSTRRTLAALRRPKIRYAIVTTTAHRAGVGVIVATVVMHGETFGGPAEAWYGSVLGTSALGAFLATLTAEWFNERLKRRAIATAVFVIAVMCSTPTVTGAPTPAVLGSILVLGFAFQTLRVCSDATVQKNAPRGTGGRVFSAYDISYNSAFLAGFVVAASLEPFVHPSLVAAVVAAWFACGACVSLVLSRGEDINKPDVPVLPRAVPSGETVPATL